MTFVFGMVAISKLGTTAKHHKVPILISYEANLLHKVYEVFRTLYKFQIISDVKCFVVFILLNKFTLL